MKKDIAEWLRSYLKPYFAERNMVVDDDTSFDALGMDSITRVELVAAIEERFELDLDPVLGFEYPTIGAMSTHIASTGTVHEKLE